MLKIQMSSWYRRSGLFLPNDPAKLLVYPPKIQIESTPSKVAVWCHLARGCMPPVTVTLVHTLVDFSS